MAYNLFPAFAFLSADYRLAANLEKSKLNFCEGDQVRIGCAPRYLDITYAGSRGHLSFAVVYPEIFPDSNPYHLASINIVTVLITP